MNTKSLVNRPVAYAVLLAGMLLPAMVFAHPGHDLSEASASHIVTSPYHVLTLAGAGALLCFAGTQVQRRVPARVLSATGALMLVAAVVLLGARL